MRASAAVASEATAADDDSAAEPSTEAAAVVVTLASLRFSVELIGGHFDVLGFSNRFSRVGVERRLCTGQVDAELVDRPLGFLLSPTREHMALHMSIGAIEGDSR